jgi:hypothetical protein
LRAHRPARLRLSDPERSTSKHSRQRTLRQGVCVGGSTVERDSHRG